LVIIYRIIAIVLIMLWGVFMWLTSNLVEFGKIDKTPDKEKELMVKFYMQVDQDIAVDERKSNAVNNASGMKDRQDNSK